MKILLSILLSLLCSTLLYAQKTEVSIQANSGLFHYSGTSATATSAITQIGFTSNSYTNNPYGNKNGFSYGADVQIQHVGKKGFIIGLQAGYEVFKSNIDINTYNPYSFELLIQTFTASNNQNSLTGQTYLQDKDIGICPYIGYQLQLKKINIDIMPGLNIGFNTNSYYKGSAIDNSGNIYQTNMTLPHAPVNLQMRFAAVAYYNKWGVTTSYAHGLTNLNKNIYGDTNTTAHSELLSFGITYKIL